MKRVPLKHVHRALVKQQLRIFGLILLLAVLGLAVWPILQLAIGSIWLRLSDPVFLPLLPAAPSRLMARSLSIGLLSTLWSVVFGLLAALGIWIFWPGRTRQAAASVLLLNLIPPFIHAQAWIFVMDRTREALLAWDLLLPNFSGTYAVVWTQAFACLPLPAGLILWSLATLPEELVELVRLEASLARAFGRVVLPALTPACLISGLFILLVQLADYGIPAVFGVNVYALDLYARLASGEQAEVVFLKAWPLTLTSLLLLLLLGWLIHRYPFRSMPAGAYSPFRHARPARFWGRLGLVILALDLAIPLLTLILEVARAPGSLLGQSLVQAMPATGFSLLNGTLAAGGSVMLAFALHDWLLGSRQAQNKLSARPPVRPAPPARPARWLAGITGLAALPFAWPAALVGLADLVFWNQPALAFVCQSPVMPAIAWLGRYLLIPLVVLAYAFKALDENLIALIRLDGPGLWQRLALLLRLCSGPALAAFLIVLALSLGEFGVSLLVTPPGYQTLSAKIYNYLHYGASETVAALCLFLLVLLLLLALLLDRLLNRLQLQRPPAQSPGKTD